MNDQTTSALYIAPIAALVCALAMLHGRITSEGDVQIDVTQIEHSGVLHKTWEVRASSGGEHEFTVEDPAVLAVVRSCVAPCSLQVHYVKRWLVPLRSSSFGVFMTLAVKEEQ